MTFYQPPNGSQIIDCIPIDNWMNCPVEAGENERNREEAEQQRRINRDMDDLA